MSADNPGRGKGKFPQRVRENVVHSELVRQRIKTTQLVNRLTNFCLGKANGKDKCELSPHQVTGILGLLRKAIPDLQAIEHLGELEHVVHHRVSSEPLSEGDWQATYGSASRPPLDS